MKGAVILSYIYSTGNEIVDSLRGINITGNIIPQNWYKTITNEKGKPDLPAIVILADILYWYRPSIVRSEETGEEVGLKKKFSDDDYLQRSYSQLEKQFGLSKRSARNAVVRLEQCGVVERITRNFLATNGTPLNNVMFIKLNVPKLLEMTFPDIYPAKDRNSLRAQNSNNFDITNKSEGTNQKERDTSLLKDNFLSNIGETYTKSTTKINSKIISKDSNSIKGEFYRIYPSIQEVKEIIKKNISYDILMTDKRIDRNALKEILSIMVDVFNQQSGTVKVNSAPYDIELVKERFLEINQFHIEYILESLKELKIEVRNIRSYLITSIYNAPMTIEFNYSNRVTREQYK